MASTLERIFEIVAQQSGVSVRKLSAQLAISQDIRMFGDDVEDFAEALANEFGDYVWQWPWHRYAELSEGLGVGFLPALLWQLATWPFRGSFEYPSQFERLELGHIAAVIEKGQWFEP